MYLLLPLKRIKSLLFSKLPPHIVFLTIDLRFFVRNLFLAKNLRLIRASKKNMFVFIIDPMLKHPGLADRIKAIVNSYNIAKHNKYQYKLFFNTPFDLKQYLQPNLVDWIINREEIEQSIFDTSFINEVSWRHNIKLKKDKQYHCYNYTGNLIPEFFIDTGYNWSSLFGELFSPSALLQEEIERVGLEKGCYISVHLRFVNALESFEQSYVHCQLSDDEKGKLIERCRNGINKIVKENDEQVVVFSDSVYFLNSIQDMPIIILPHDSIGHISEEGDHDHVLKAFLDLFVMSRSKKVYSICAPELYEYSCYAICAARIGNVPYSKLTV